MAAEQMTIESVLTSATTAQQLYNHLFEACNILRGPINQDEYKNYVIPILFLKRISDVYDEETAFLQEKYGEDYELFEEDYRTFDIPADCHWSDIRKKSQDVGKTIQAAMTGIELANQEKLEGLFSSFDDASWSDKGKLSDALLKNLVEHMSKINVGNKDYSADVMGDAYEYLIKKFADMSKKNAGEFYTPRSVVKLMVKMLAPQPGESVYDPACGTGGMLIEALRYMHDAKESYGKICGQEKNLSTSAIARMNLFLHGKKAFNIRQGDTLRSPAFVNGNALQTFSCVLANPPFSLKNWGADAFVSDQWGRNLWGCPTDSSADFAWLQHMVKSMDPVNGRLAVVMPQGVLFHGGREGEIRQKLIESDKLDAVITLVGGLFYGAGVSACILYLNNNKPADHRGKVCMIDGSRIYTAQRAQNIMTDDDVDKAFVLYQGYADVIGSSAVVPIETIREKGYTLSVNTYIEKAAVETESPEDVRRRFVQALQDVKSAEEKLHALLVEGGYIHE